MSLIAMKTAILTTLLIAFSALNAAAAPVQKLDSLESRSPVLQQLRADIKKGTAMSGNESGPASSRCATSSSGRLFASI